VLEGDKVAMVAAIKNRSWKVERVMMLSYYGRSICLFLL